MKYMMSHAHKTVLAAVILALTPASYGAPSKATNAAQAESVHSTFVVPKVPEEGHDPFFPKATSLYQVVDTKRPVADSGVNLLKLNGILGSSLAQINNVTLSVGETEEVKTTSGSIPVRLVEIRAADGIVVIEASGQRRLLKFNSR